MMVYKYFPYIFFECEVDSLCFPKRFSVRYFKDCIISRLPEFMFIFSSHVFQIIVAIKYKLRKEDKKIKK